MGIQLAELSDEELDTFFEKFMQPANVAHFPVLDDYRQQPAGLVLPYRTTVTSTGLVRYIHFQKACRHPEHNLQPARKPCRTANRKTLRIIHI